MFQKNHWAPFLPPLPTILFVSDGTGLTSQQLRSQTLTLFILQLNEGSQRRYLPMCAKDQYIYARQARDVFFNGLLGRSTAKIFESTIAEWYSEWVERTGGRQTTALPPDPARNKKGWAGRPVGIKFKHSSRKPLPFLCSRSRPSQGLASAQSP